MDDLYSMLNNGIAVVKHRRETGEISDCPCTLNVGLIPSTKLSKQDSTINRASGNIGVFAMDISEWRSFRVEDIVSVTDGLTSVELSYMGEVE